ncbi:hypothetical protein HEQ62_09545 [Haematospirillum jordaniae]|uniref:hypothetical protein n=1 Tax=Haematospirillum jordaniae TaxID=1549855 RepID=UPI0014331E0F|nr:hypothetical protein [Haematospirillum jordaniae]NKD45783.1 hypothetical protein [Haematospirillum jordaniae]NKD57960.1 hypothetical protein [Haematospirillum jordaniae]NKD60019.1 hypothetical protein [Haematospirillum jordaniae]NKD67953.1 hypothetical protein [Haematospirillum jordaniae]NKD80046.1 hypothetical protein [Haematospirillum jordaniae]
MLCSYRGGIGNPPSFSFARLVPRLGPIARLLDRLSLLSLRQFIASNRDFFANVRTVGYQVGLLEDALRLASPSGVTIRVDEALAQDAACEKLASFGQVEVRAAGDLLSANEAADSVLLIYPDALGLGWAPLESRLPRGPVYAVNGRRRIFPLNACTRRKLRWRRLLASTRATELLATIAIVPLAAGLAAWDALRGKS